MKYQLLRIWLESKNYKIEWCEIVITLLFVIFVMLSFLAERALSSIMIESVIKTFMGIDYVSLIPVCIK